MRLAVLTCGMLPIPAVQGGAVENLIDFYLEYNDRKKIHHITVYSPWDVKVKENTSISSDVNHYCYIDVTSIKARIERRIYKYLHKNEYTIILLNTTLKKYIQTSRIKNMTTFC